MALGNFLRLRTGLAMNRGGEALREQCRQGGRVHVGCGLDLVCAQDSLGRDAARARERGRRRSRSPGRIRAGRDGPDRDGCFAATGSWLPFSVGRVRAVLLSAQGAVEFVGTRAGPRR